MDRRAFLAGAAALLAAPLAAEAQSAASKQRIVVLSLASPPEHARALEDGLRALGYVPGATITIEHRSAIAEAAELPGIAKEAIASRPDVIAAIGTTAAISARRVTRDIPIVTVAGDIVAAGLVANLGRPEGNVTGLSFFAVDLLLKRFELLTELVPEMRRVAVLVQSPVTPTTVKAITALRSAARTRGVEVREVLLARFEDVAAAFAQRRDSREALILMQSPVFDVRAAEIGRLATQHRLIVILPWKEYVTGGGLIAYAPDIIGLWRRAATYVDKILKGANPADLPVEQPTKFELVINLKTAKALGLTIPRSLLLRAEQVIE